MPQTWNKMQKMVLVGIPSICKKGPEEMPYTLKKSLGEISLTQKDGPGSE